MIHRLILLLSLGLLLGLGPARAGLDVPPTPAPAPDLTPYAKKTDLSGYATTDALSAATSGTVTKADAIPTTGPGLNKCRFTWVPSPLVQSGGVTGTAGKCSRIVQCGDSAVHTVHLFDIGNGC